MITSNKLAAYNVPSGIIFDMLREGSAKRPGVFTKIGLETFVDPRLEGCAMNEKAKQNPIVRLEYFEEEEWLFFNSLVPNVSIIRGSISDERGNISFEQEGAYLGAIEMATSSPK